MIINADEVRAMLDYDPASGIFVWKARPINYFHDVRAFNSWNARYAGKVAGTKKSGGYRHIRLGGGRYEEHRLAWLYIKGKWPKNSIDHINGDSGDNRFANLREATCSQNQSNVGLRQDNTSGTKGVYWCSDRLKWRACISVKGRRLNLGHFENIQEAAAAYAGAARENFGEFVRLT